MGCWKEREASWGRGHLKGGRQSLSSHTKPAMYGSVAVDTQGEEQFVLPLLLLEQVLIDHWLGGRR